MSDNSCFLPTNIMAHGTVVQTECQLFSLHNWCAKRAALFLLAHPNIDGVCTHATGWLLSLVVKYDAASHRDDARLLLCSGRDLSDNGTQS